MTANTGGPAFPALNFIVPHDLAEAGVRRLGETQGMTLRDYFAAKAMQSFVSRWAGHSNHDEAGITYSITAKQAYAMADAMLAARGAP